MSDAATYFAAGFFLFGFGFCFRAMMQGCAEAWRAIKNP